jgi:hypothetical protein
MIAMRSSIRVALGLTIGMLLLSPARPSAAEVAFTDQRGKLVTLDGPARRVVAFPKPPPRCTSPSTKASSTWWGYIRRRRAPS